MLILTLLGQQLFFFSLDAREGFLSGRIHEDGYDLEPGWGTQELLSRTRC